MRSSSLILAALLAASCDSGSKRPTAAENRQLDEAEAMLDAAPNELGEADRAGTEQDPASRD